MKLIFGSANTPGSWLIQLATFSRWSHVGIVYGGMVIEARFPRVRMTTLEDFRAHYPRHEIATLPCKDNDAAWVFAFEQIGKLYDVGGLFAIVFQRRQWQSGNRWFCSELPPAATNAGGTPWFRAAERNRITPAMLYAVCQPEAQDGRE